MCVRAVSFILSYFPLPTPSRIIAAGRETAEAFKRLLELIHQTMRDPSPENKGKLMPLSNEVDSYVKELMAAMVDIRGIYQSSLSISLLSNFIMAYKVH